MVSSAIHRPVAAALRLLAAGAIGIALLAGVSSAFAQTARCLLADGFDYPVGKPEASGYHKARGYTPNGHLGEDWNGNGGGDSDLGDPIYATARGVVVVSENVHVGWGNCIIVRHAFRDTNGAIKMVDSLYGHLDQRKATVGDIVERGQIIGTMGSNFGQYPVHLHFEIRKNLQIGMNRSQFAKDNSNYYSPTAFIQAHRTTSSDFAKVDIPTRGFADYGKQLPSGAQAPVVKPSVGTGFRIPVYHGDNASSKTKPQPQDAVSKIKASADEHAKKNAPPPGAAPEPGDFWSRLKAKMSRGKVVQPEPEKK